MCDLDQWEQEVVAECRRRLAADPKDDLAREILEDVPNAMNDTSTSFSWFLIETPHPPVSQEEATASANRSLAFYASKGIYPSAKERQS